MPRALLAPYDKTGLPELARDLVRLGFELCATGNTERVLREAGLPVTSVSELTGFPEMLDGRVKTLHPAVHGGLLARRDLESHMSTLAEHGIGPIDVLVAGLYPFESTIAAGATRDEAIEQIDIGGPAMIRSAAKNHAAVAVMVRPEQYRLVIDEIERNGSVTPATRVRLAREAFAHTAAYDSMIAGWMSAGEDEFPQQLSLAGNRVRELRYGENPHQRAALYRSDPVGGAIAGAEQLHGKELSYNNIVDAAAAWELVCEFEAPAVVIVKHTNPCGTAVSSDLSESWRRAFECDTLSAFGGVVACNREVDGATAELMSEVFLEVVVAPHFTAEAVEVLGARKNLRLLRTGRTGGLLPEWVIRVVPGGFLAQTPDVPSPDPAELRVVTQRQPAPDELEDLLFAWKVCKHTKSNAIVLARGAQAFGVGAGQMSRVDAVRLAVSRAGGRASGSVLASDAFFPFPDGVEAAGAAGVVAVMQPGGGMREPEVIAAADRLGMAMVFTGTRHFRH
ncbi:MAG: bifunctional phosphoribosylaminoimidazolecarboxamide formyltransferase/IMP cyclohydrolase [Candidatus Dormibacteria bacterium]